jgi:hypothetical protein
MTLSELLEVAYRFHPRGVHPATLGYKGTEEHGRQRAAVRAARSEYPKWAAMLERLEARFSLENRSMYLFSDDFFDSAYLATVFYTSQGEEHGLGLHVSILGPYYVVHRLGLPGEEPCAEAVTQEIEATYPGYEPIPPGLGDAPVPDVLVSGRGFGVATIYDCLLGGRPPNERRSPLPRSGPTGESPPTAPVRNEPKNFHIRLVPGKPKH